jgi:hypothetical protein
VDYLYLKPAAGGLVPSGHSCSKITNHMAMPIPGFSCSAIYQVVMGELSLDAWISMSVLMLQRGAVVGRVQNSVVHRAHRARVLRLYSLRLHQQTPAMRCERRGRTNPCAPGSRPDTTQLVKLRAPSSAFVCPGSSFPRPSILKFLRDHARS